jgi:hypothetical protein
LLTVGQVYTQTLRNVIQEFFVQCSRSNSSCISLAEYQSEVGSEVCPFIFRKEFALQEMICAVVDLDELLPTNFMKSHFAAVYAPSFLPASSLMFQQIQATGIEHKDTAICSRQLQQSAECVFAAA